MRLLALILVAVAQVCLVGQGISFAQNYQLEVEGAPGYDGQSGYVSGFTTFVNRHGIGATSSDSYTNGTYNGARGLRWEFGGNAEELGSIGGDDIVYGINAASQVIGRGKKYDSNGALVGWSALLWNGGLDPIELGSLYAGGFNQTDGAVSINDSGTIVGWSSPGLGQNSAVRWSAGNIAPVQLGHLGVSATGEFFAEATSVNGLGTAVGRSIKFDANFLPVGQFAVRWDANGTTATELGTLSSGNETIPDYSAWKINDANIVIGYSDFHDALGYYSEKAIRWDAAGNAAELGNLGTSALGESYSTAWDVNSRGTAVGWSTKFDTAGVPLGYRAVRWGANSDVAIELGAFDSMDNSDSFAYGVNRAGLAVGLSEKRDSTGLYLGYKAAIWLPSGNIIDLNSLDVVPEGGQSGDWDLQSVDSITNNGWIAGYGSFTSNAGVTYNRSYVARLGLGGVWVNTFPGGIGLWQAGENWESGTPALRQGGARFAGVGNDQIELDESVDTQFVNFENGNVRLNVAEHQLNVRDRLHIFQNARAAINTRFDPQHDLIGFVHGNIINDGVLSPGNSPGLLNLIGDLTNTGTLEFEIAGLDPDRFDRLWISGTFNAGGTLKLLLDGYAPSVGDEFDLLDWGVLNYQGMNLDFSSAVLATGLRWDTTNFASSGSLRVSAIPEPGNLIGWLAVSFGFVLRRQRQKSPVYPKCSVKS